MFESADAKSVGFCNVNFGDNVICRNSGFAFQTFVKPYEPVILPPFMDGASHFNSARMPVMLPSSKG